MKIKSEALSKFLKKYCINILDDFKKVRHAIRQPLLFSDPDNKDFVDIQYETYDEALFTLTIPESALNRIVEVENSFYNHLDDPQQSRRSIFEAYMDQKKEEQEIRTQCEAVKNAFETYSMLLHLYGFKQKFPL